MAQEKILIVEDENIVAEQLRNALELWGYIPLWANSKEQAVQLAYETQPDLVLMDITLTDELDGVEAARQIRSRYDIPLVYLTAHTEKDVVQQAKSTEPYGYLVKPVNNDELRSTVEIVLYKHTLDTQYRERLETLVEERTAELKHTNEKLKHAYAAFTIVGSSVSDEEFRHEKILIIDDEPDILKTLSIILASEGYDILTAADGLEGMQRFQEESPSLVITDVRMPRKDGLEVLRDIKNSGSDADVIVLTGYSDEATAINCLQAGAYDYLRKPLEDIELIAASVKKALHKKHLQIQNRQLIRQLEEMAITDPLTKLFNRRHLQTILDHEIDRSERYVHSFCGAMLDVDHFKKVNDTYGHLFGDYILAELADIIRRTFRSTDRLFRYGGEEFFIIMPETGYAEAERAVDRLREIVKRHPFIFDDQQTSITISIGCVLYPDQATNKTELLKYADNALYQAKEMGRDQVIFNSAIIG